MQTTVINGLSAKNAHAVHPIKLERILDLFLSSHSVATNQAYEKDLSALAVFLGETRAVKAGIWVLDASSSEVNMVAATWQRQMSSSGLSPATINRRIAAIRSLLSLGRALGSTTSEIHLSDLRACPTRDTRGPGTEAIAQMVTLLEQERTPKARRDLAILRLLYDLGLRRAETVSIDLADINLESGELWVKGKGRPAKERFSLPEPTSRALIEWLEVRGDEAGPLITNFDRANKGGRLSPSSVYRIVRALGERVGVQARPHGIRHTAVTEAIKLAAREGLDLSVVQAFSRHADPRTLFLYRDAEGDPQASVSSAIANELGF
jgi:integrase/recombinase XerC